jgi:hypothetical protein
MSYETKQQVRAGYSGTAAPRTGGSPGKRTLTQGLPSCRQLDSEPSRATDAGDDPSDDPFNLHLGGKSHVIMTAPIVITFPPTTVRTLAKTQAVTLVNLTGESLAVASVEVVAGGEDNEFWYMGALPAFGEWGRFDGGQIAFNPKRIGTRRTTFALKDVDGRTLGEISAVGIGEAELFKSADEQCRVPQPEKEDSQDEITPEERAAFWAKFKEVEDEPPPIDPVEVDEMTDRLVMAGVLLGEGHGDEAYDIIAGVIRWKHEHMTDGHVQKKAGGYDMGTQQVYAFLYTAEDAVYTMLAEANSVQRGEEFSAKHYEAQLRRWGLAREAMAILMGYLPASKSNMVLISRQGGKVARDLGIIGMSAPFLLRNPAAQIGSLARGLAWFGGTRVGTPIVAGATAAMETLPGRALFGTATRTTATIAAGTNLTGQVLEHGSELEDYNWGSVGLDYVVGAVSNKVVRAITARFPGRIFNPQEWKRLGTLGMLGQFSKQQGAILLYGTTVSVVRSTVANTGRGRQVAADQVEGILQMAKSAAVESWLHTDQGKTMFPNGRNDPKMTALSSALGAVIKVGVRDAFDVVPQSNLKEIDHE